jgi:hypothetical protein
MFQSLNENYNRHCISPLGMLYEYEHCRRRKFVVPVAARVCCLMKSTILLFYLKHCVFYFTKHYTEDSCLDVNQIQNPQLRLNQSIGIRSQPIITYNVINNI